MRTRNLLNALGLAVIVAGAAALQSPAQAGASCLTDAQIQAVKQQLYNSCGSFGGRATVQCGTGKVLNECCFDGAWGGWC